jgi:hypothetical protein
MAITYVEPDEVLVSEPKGARKTAWGTFYPGQSLTGYGKKIASRYIVRVGNRWYRVYITQISNAGSAWIMSKGRKLHLHDTFAQGVK